MEEVTGKVKLGALHRLSVSDFGRRKKKKRNPILTDELKY